MPFEGSCVSPPRPPEGRKPVPGYALHRFPPLGQSGQFICYKSGQFYLLLTDKVAKQNLSRTRRLRFYLDYVQRQRLSRDDKKRIRKIVRFFEGRE